MTSFTFIFGEKKIKNINIVYNDNPAKTIDKFNNSSILCGEPYIFCTVNVNNRYHITITFIDLESRKKIENGKIEITLERLGTDRDGVMYRTDDSKELSFTYDKVTFIIINGNITVEYGMTNPVETIDTQEHQPQMIELVPCDLLRNVEADIRILKYYSSLDKDQSLCEKFQAAKNALKNDLPYSPNDIITCEEQLVELIKNDEESAKA